MVTGGRGSTIRLEATYRDGGGSLVDPVNPLLTIRDPSGADVVVDAVPTRESLGKYYYDYDVPSTAQLGTWTAVWSGTINGVYIEAPVQFTIVEAGEIGFGIRIIERVRALLGEAGEEKISLIVNEVQTSANNSTVYTDFRRISDVTGVWLASDTSHTGTNYYTGGGYDSMKGKIYLGTALPSENEDVIITYSFHEGIPDSTIDQLLLDSQKWVIGRTDLEFTYGSVFTVREYNLEMFAISRCICMCVLVINGANAAQMGYNFRLEEFEIQTKLWGEGMIAGELFKQYYNMFLSYMSIIGIKIDFVIGRPTKQDARYSFSDVFSRI